MTLQDVETCAATRFPQAHCVVTTATGKGSPIGAKANSPDPIGMSPKGSQWPTTRNIPYTDLACCRSCCQQISMWIQCHRENISEGIGKHRFLQIGIGKIDFLHIHTLEVCMPNGQRRKIIAS